MSVSVRKAVFRSESRHHFATEAFTILFPPAKAHGCGELLKSARGLTC